jgi:autotransporter-associated beta strand protein
MVVKLRNKFYLNANYSSIFKFLSMNFNQYFSLTPKKGKKYTCKALILINIFFFIISFEKVLADTVSSSSDTSFDSDVDLQGDIKENRIYDITNSSVYTLRGNIISSSYNLTKNGNGTLSVTSNNDGNFSSSITVNAGILAAGDNDAFGSATIILNSGSLSSSNTTARNLSNTIQIQNSSSLGDASNNGVLTLSGSLSFTDKNLTLTSLSNNSISSINLATDPQTLSVASGVTSTITGAVSNGILTKSGAGSLVLAGTNTYDGETIISAGTLEVQGTLGNGNYSGNITNSATMSINSSSNQTLSGTISGSGVLSKNGSGTLTLTGTNTYSGQTTIEGGTVVASNSSSLGATPGSVTSTNIVLNNGTLQTTNSFSIGSNKGITVVGSGGTINTDASTTFTYGGVISSNGTLTKTGDGTLTLSGANTYTGATTVSAGTLNVTGTLSDDTAITVSSGATYDVDASDTIKSIDGAGTIDIESSQTLTAGDATNKTFSGVIQGSGGLAKTGTGTLTLSGTNTYTGDTTISQGGITLQGQLESGNYDGLIANSGTFTIDSSSNQTLAGVISGTGALNKSGSGTLTLSGTNTYSGSTTITNGTISVSSSANLGATPGSADADNIIFNGGTLSATNDFTLGTNKGITLTGNGTIDVSSSNTMTFDGIITDSGNLTKSGSGTLVLGGANQNDGIITVNAGTLEISDQYSLGSSSGGTVVADGASLKITDAITIANENLTLNGNGISNSGALQTTNSSGTITLTGQATLGSDTTINIGDGNLTLDGRLTAGSNNYDLTIIGGDGTIRPSGGLVLNSGNLTMSATGTFFAENSSTYSGGTTVTAGAIQYGNNDAFGTGDITMTGGKFYTSDASDFTIDENLNLQGSITLGNSGDSNTITFSGTNTLTGNTTASIDSAVSMAAIDDGSNTYNLIKSGSGTLTLSGNNGYDGTTTVSAGTLTVSGTLSDSTAVTVASGAIYDVDASDNIASVSGAGNIELASSQTLTAGDSNDKTLSGVISGSGGFTKAGSSTYTLSGTNTYTGNTNINSGTLTVSGTLSDSTAITVASGATYDFDVSDTIASVDGAGAIEIANAVTLTTGDANDQELSGTVSGSGSITKVGNGILTLSGTNSYSGDTTISAGTLLVTSQLGGGSYAGDISNAGDLGINSSNNQTLSGVISGSGTINKSGSGELTLTGANTFDGTINIAGGTLFAGGSSDGSNKITEGNIIVKGGTLSGSGIIDGNVTFSSTAGTLAPGNSIGTLTIDDNLTLSADDTTNIEFNLTTADKIVINGNTELAGTISLYPEDTTYSDVTHTIVDASGGGTFNGTFSTEIMNNESNLNDATWDIVYDTSAKTVSLQIAEAASACNINCTTTVSSSKDIAKVFDNATSGTLKAVKDVLDSSTVSSVNTELDKLKGTVMATSSIQSNTNHNYFNKAVASTTSLSNTTFVTNFTSTTNELTLASLQDQGLYGDKKKYSEYYDYSDVSVLGFIKNNKNKSFFERFESDDRASFLRTFGTNTKRDNIGEGYTGYNSDTAGILFGEQFKKDEINFNGYSIGISKTDTTYNDSYGDAEIYTMHSSMFKQIDEDDYAFNLLGSAFVSKTNSNRNVSVFGTSVDDKYKSDFYDVGLNLEVQHIAKYDFDGYKISPSAKINYSYIFKGDTKETGGDLALSVDNEDLFIIKPEVGISISKNFSEKDNKLSQLELAAFVSRDYFIEGTENKARFASGSTFNHDLPRDKEDYYSLGVGYNFLNKENNSSLMANAFLLENTKEDISSNIFSITFRKFFGEFAKGRIPSVIAKKDIPVKSDQDQNDNEEQTKVVLKKDPPMKSDKDLEQNNEVISSDNEIGKDETIIATFPDQNINNDIKKSVEDKIKNFEKKIEIVLKENPTKEEVEEIYISLNNEMRNSYKRDLTLDDVYNNLFANCYVVEKNLKRLINYYDKLQLYQILDKCSQLKNPKVHLIANRLHDIQMEERSAIEILYLKYLKILNYIPIITFIALIILFYEIIRRFIVSYHNSRIIS